MPCLTWQRQHTAETVQHSGLFLRPWGCGIPSRCIPVPGAAGAGQRCTGRTPYYAGDALCMTELKENSIVEELWAIAMARATDFMAVRSGALEIRSTDELSPEQTAAIASIERSTGGLKVKFYDKLKALELLGKYLGLFESRQGSPDPQQTNLLQAILEATAKEVDTHDLPELQQAAAAGDDLVEQTPAAEP